ncbi:MAG TPA: DUF5615 family PIN-like protein [Anaerolineae bacterium]|nr:DUF5615 family PIN-like protein [Anaerolineae bacterium]
MTTGFLFDENLPPALAMQLHRRAPAIRVFAVGYGDAPPWATRDPDLLCWLEKHDCWLVTNNRASMPRHLRDHLTEGRHVPGILIIRAPLNFGEVVEGLILVHGASLPDEYRDRIEYLPRIRPGEHSL